SYVPNESQDRAHAAYMPDPTWAVNGYPPGSSRDKASASVSKSSKGLSTRPRQRAHTHRSSSRPTPDAITAAPFPTTLSTTVFSERPWGWFDASPRRATPEDQPPSIPSFSPAGKQPRHQLLGLPPTFALTNASDLNPTEGAWAHLKRDLGNL